MDKISEKFLAAVEDHISAAGIDPTNFGRTVMNDPSFVFELRKGRSPSARTMDRVLAWIAENPPQRVAG